MIEPLSYPINEANKKKMLEFAAPDAKIPLQKFFLSITYISHQKFKQILKNKITEIINIRKNTSNSRPIFVYIDTNRYENYRNKSNYWIYTYLKYFLENKNISVKLIFTLDSNKIQDNDIILLLDDCIYSGEQMSNAIFAMRNKTMKRLNIVLFVPFMSARGKKTVEYAAQRNRQLQTCQFIISQFTEIQPLSRFLSEMEGNALFKYYNRNSTELQKYNIYFDHKVGDYMSSFPQIFSGLVPNAHNANLEQNLKYILYQYSGSDMNMIADNIKKQFQLFPLLQNCEYIQEPDFHTSSCPYPPYKEDYHQFLQRKKNVLRKYHSFTLPKLQAGNSKKKPKHKR
jgi:hypothetical protein